LNDNRLIPEYEPVRRRISGYPLLRIAAAALILIGIGAGLTYLGQKGILSREKTISTSENQKNLQVTLPDGSIIFMNRNTQLSYGRDFGRKGREVKLSGEAFFDITTDILKPFIVNAGNARIKVIGTSFNVISSNSESEVEVYVKTGKVMVSDNTGKKNLEIDPGFIGTISEKAVNKKTNDNPNYMSWNTGLLIYNGQTLDVVFKDLGSVYNMKIVADNPEILHYQWTSPIINQPQEKIIRLICASFELSYTKDGDTYHLHEK